MSINISTWKKVRRGSYKGDGVHVWAQNFECTNSHLEETVDEVWRWDWVSCTCTVCLCFITAYSVIEYADCWDFVNICGRRQLTSIACWLKNSSNCFVWALRLSVALFQSQGSYYLLSISVPILHLVCWLGCSAQWQGPDFAARACSDTRTRARSGDLSYGPVRYSHRHKQLVSRSCPTGSRR